MIAVRGADLQGDFAPVPQAVIMPAGV